MCRPPLCFRKDSLARHCYFFTGFLALFLGAGLVVFISPSRPPIRLIASAALKGNCLTEVSVCPVVEFRVTSTRRLLANLMTQSWPEPAFALPP